MVAFEGGNPFEAHGELATAGNRERPGAITAWRPVIVVARDEGPRTASTGGIGEALEICAANGQVHAGGKGD
jgi:hypothetical protein